MRSDQGIVLLRSLLKRQVDAVARGEDPEGVAFEPAGELVKIAAGTATLTEMPGDVES